MACQAGRATQQYPALESRGSIGDAAKVLRCSGVDDRDRASRQLPQALDQGLQTRFDDR